MLLLLATAPAADASLISDDFADGNDTAPFWSHFAPVGGSAFNAATLSYLISVPATLNPSNPARATSLREDQSFGDVVVAANLVAFGNVPGHSYGVIARSTSTAAATHDGYALRVVVAPGSIELVRIDNQAVTTLATRSVALSTSTDYRLVLTITGSAPALLTGKLFATSDLSNPIASLSFSDSQAPVYTAGFTGVAVEDAGFLQSLSVIATFDEFVASAPNSDSDADGLSDGMELGIGTLPNDADTDDDGLLDGQESGTGSFSAKPAVSTEADGAQSVFATDLDGDGDTDVLSGSFLGDTIAWYPNDGSPAVGAWTESSISTTAASVYTVFAADVDGDGDTDVLSASAGDNTIAWYQNDGTPDVGAWTEYAISTVANGARSVFAADMDGDGDLDVLSASLNDDKIAWYENDGTPDVGAWTAYTISTAADGAWWIVAADVDGDGDTDVLSASNNDDTIAWYENDGTPAVGAWTEHTISTVANGARSVVASDVDGDGDIDVLSASFLDDTIAWYENDGTPAVGAWLERTISTAAASAQSVFAADVDGDGDIDVLSASQNDHTIAWYENDGTPAVGAWTEHPISNAADSARSVFAADMDGDGDLDVLSASYTDDSIEWYEQTNLSDPLDPDSDDDGLSDAAEVNTYGTKPNLADTDGDGLLDLFEVTYGLDPLESDENNNGRVDSQDDFDLDGLGNAAEAVIGTSPSDGDSDDDGLLDGQEIGTGIFSTPSAISTSADEASSVVATDVDGDGDMDVIAAAFMDFSISWYANDGTPSVGAWTEHVITTTLDTFNSVFAVDLDGDGDQDVLAGGYLGIWWYENDGTPSVGAWTEHSVAPHGGGSVFAADVDGDGDMDVLTERVDTIAWHENDGTPAGNFWTEHEISATADDARSVFAADVDGDGDIDALSASFLDDTIAWYENDGTPSVGVWTEHPISSTADGAESVFAADVDGDGDLDVLSASWNTQRIAWHENDGTPSVGAWSAHVISTLGSGGDRVFAADVDHDGDFDAISSSYGDTIAWHENDGTPAVGAWTEHVISTAADEPSSVFAADVDGDGDTDVLSSSRLDDTVAWYEQTNVSDPLDPDSDDDGLLDGAEVNTHGTDPNLADSDGDGLSDGAEVTIHGTNPTLADTDGDASLDGSDNCPVTSNPTQSDIGGVLGEPADGWGDACQCGDVDDSGIVDLLDVSAYRDSLANPALILSGVAKCSVLGSAGPCEILDVTVIRRALGVSPLPPGIAQVCAAALGP